MKLKHTIAICISLVLLVVIFILNWKYEVIAFHPFMSDGQHDLKVMTWNVSSPNGTNRDRQVAIAKLILKVDADFVLLNEYNQDSCAVADSLIKTRYPFTEEYQSHKRSGDIFYSKLIMSNSGHVYIPIHGKVIQTIKATIANGNDSVQLFGVHLASIHYDINAAGNKKNKTTSYERYKDTQNTRCFQAHWTKYALLQSKHPVIVMGDMNDFNCSAPLDTLASCGLKDAWWEGGNGYGATFHDGWMRLRIDHILHSKELKLESIKVIETDQSDHNPIVAGFSLNTNTNRTN